MLCENKQFKIYDSGGVSTISWRTVFNNRRVLLCSTPRLNHVFSFEYLKTIETYAEFYRLLGVEQTYYLSSHSGIGLIHLCNRSLKLPVLNDHGNFIEYLNNLVNQNNRPVDFLKAFWSFQVLINDGIVEQISQQNLENYVSTFVQETKNIELLRRLQIKDDTLVFTPTFLSRSMQDARDFYFYKLHPNISLKQYLLESYCPNDK